MAGDKHRPERYVRRGVAGEEDELDVRCRYCRAEWPCDGAEEVEDDDGDD